MVVTWAGRVERFVPRGVTVAGLAMFSAALMLISALAVSKAMAEEKSAIGPVKIVALGDSLTAGYELPPSASFPAQLEAALKKRETGNCLIEKACTRSCARK